MTDFNWDDIEILPFDPEGEGYDYKSAYEYGITPDETGHWQSRVPETGLILKGMKHPSISETLKAEEAEGYQVYQEGGRYYSKPKDQFSWDDYEPVTEETPDVSPEELPEEPDYSTFGGIAMGVKTAVKGIPKIPITAAETALRAIRGGDYEIEETELDRWISTLEQWKSNFEISEAEAKKKFIKIPFTDITLKQGDIASAEESIGYSLTNMLAMKLGQMGGGAVGSLATPFVGKVTGIATGTAAGMLVAQRATTDQFLDMFKGQIIEKLGNTPEAQEVYNTMREEMGRDPFWYGLAEAIPEVAGNWLMFGIAGLGKKQAAKLGLKGITDAVAKENGSKMLKAIVKLGVPTAKAAGMITEELMTETVTQMIQGTIEYRNGLRDEPPTLEGSLQEVLGPVLLATPVLGAGAHIMNKLKTNDRVQKRIDEILAGKEKVLRKSDAQEILDRLFSEPVPETTAPPADISEVPTFVEKQMEGPVTPEEVADIVEFEEAPPIKESDVEIIPVEEEIGPLEMEPKGPPRVTVSSPFRAAEKPKEEPKKEPKEMPKVTPKEEPKAAPVGVTNKAIEMARQATPEEAQSFLAKAKVAEEQSDKLRAMGELQTAMDMASEAQMYREAHDAYTGKLKVPSKQKKIATPSPIGTLEDWRKTYTIDGKKYLEGAKSRRARKINQQIDAAYYAAKKEMPEKPLFKKVKKVLSEKTERAWKAKRTKFTPAERKRMQQEVGARDRSLVDSFMRVNTRELPDVKGAKVTLAPENDVTLAIKYASKLLGGPSVEVVRTDNKKLKRIGASTVYAMNQQGQAKLLGIVFVENSEAYKHYPILNVLGHEAWHVLRLERPDLAKEFEEWIYKNRIKDEYDLFHFSMVTEYPEEFDITHPEVKRSARWSQMDVHEYVLDRIKEEWIARFAGLQWTREPFLDKMQKQLPEVFGKLINILMELFRRLKASLVSDPSGLQFVPLSKIRQAEDKLADVYLDYIKYRKQQDELAEMIANFEGDFKMAINMRTVPGVESIVAASIRIDGKYYTGLTHTEAIQNANKELGRAWETLDRDNPSLFDGFKTSKGRYVTRGEAMAIAEKADQLEAEDVRDMKGRPDDEALAEYFKPGELRQIKMAVKDQKSTIADINLKEIKGYATETREDILRLLKITGTAGNLKAFLKKAGISERKAGRIAAIARSMEEYPFPDPSWTARELEKFDKRFPEYKFWYEKTRWLEDVFHDKSDLDLFRGLALLSHTSRNKGTLANMVEFVKAWTKWHAGERVESGLVDDETISRVLDAKTLAQMFRISKTSLGFEEGEVKVKAFAENFAAVIRQNKQLREAIKTVVDVWVNRYFFPTRYNIDSKGAAIPQPLSGVQHHRIQQHMREVERILSESTGNTWTPDMAQAALWFYIREQYELQPDIQKGQEGYDFDETLRIIAAKWAGIADKFASDEITHAYILMKLRDPRVRFILDHYTKKDNDFKMALTEFQGTGLFTGEEWDNQPEDANRPMRIHFFEAGTISNEVQTGRNAAKRMRAVIETGQIYNLDHDSMGYKEKYNVMPQDHYSLAAMENAMLEDGWVGFQTENKVALFEPTRVHEMKKYQLSISPEVSNEVIKSVEKEIKKLEKVATKKKATEKEKSQAAYQKQVLRAILSNLRLNVDMIKKGQLDELYEWTTGQLDDLLNHPLIDVDEILPVQGRWENNVEPGISVVLEAGDIDILKGRVAQFLQYNGQFEGYISEVISDVGERAMPYETDEKGNPKRDKNGKVIYKVAQNQAPSVILYWKGEMSEADLKEMDTFLQKNGFPGSTYIPEKNITLLHHIPKYMSKHKFLNNAMQAIIDIKDLDPLFNKLSAKFAGFNQVWFKHTILNNPWQEKARGERYENLIKKGYTTGRDIGFTASPDVVAGARDKREGLLKEGKDIFAPAPRPIDPEAKTGEAQFIAKTVYSTEKVIKEKKAVLSDFETFEEYVLPDGTAGYKLSSFGQIADVWSTKEGRGALAVLSAIANGGRYAVVENGPSVDWFVGFGLEVTDVQENRTMLQFKEGMSYDPYVLAGVYESTWNKRIDADTDSANILNEIVLQYGESLRSGMGAEKSRKIKAQNSEYLKRNWLTYKGGTDATRREGYNPFKNVLVQKAKTPAKNLLIQISSNKLREEATTQGDQYFDTLYSQREGYVRPDDFWEVPDWMARAAYTIDADVYVARNINEAINFLKASDYEHVMTSVMDSNKDTVKRMLEGYGGKVILGGYIKKDYFPEQENVLFLENLKEAAEEIGVPYKEGYDYSHFKGTETVPRLECSQGCLYRCAFCTVPKKIIEAPQATIDQQVEAFKDLDFKLVYLNDKTFGQAKNYKYLEQINQKLREQNPDFQGFIIQTTAVDFNKMDKNFIMNSGIKYVELGAETLNDDILKKLTKPHRVGHLEVAANKIRSMGLKYIPNVIVGLAGVQDGKLWTETTETYQKTLDYLEKHKDIISHVNAYVLATYEGTKLGEQLGTEIEADTDENVIAKSWLKNKEVHEKFYQDVLNFATERLNEDAARNVEVEEIKHINEQFKSRRSYADAPDWSLGFPGNPFMAKGFYDQNYPMTIKVRVKFPDQTFEDEIKGLNVYHALERANRNWDGADIELIDIVEPIFVTKKNMVIYHGTGFGFDQYDEKYIGTKGEGATAFGWGLYFTELWEIARHYASKIGRKSQPDKKWTGRLRITDANMGDLIKEDTWQNILKDDFGNAGAMMVKEFKERKYTEKQIFKAVSEAMIALRTQYELKTNKRVATEFVYEGHEPHRFIHITDVKKPDGSKPNFMEWYERITDEHAKMINDHFGNEQVRSDTKYSKAIIRKKLLENDAEDFYNIIGGEFTASMPSGKWVKDKSGLKVKESMSIEYIRKDVSFYFIDDGRKLPDGSMEFIEKGPSGRLWKLISSDVPGANVHKLYAKKPGGKWERVGKYPYKVNAMDAYEQILLAEGIESKEMSGWYITQRAGEHITPEKITNEEAVDFFLEYEEGYRDDLMELLPKRQTGKEYYRQLASLVGSKKHASKVLLAAGIDGIQYPAGSLGFGLIEKWYITDAEGAIVPMPNKVIKALISDSLKYIDEVGINRGDEVAFELKERVRRFISMIRERIGRGEDSVRFLGNINATEEHIPMFEDILDKLERGEYKVFEKVPQNYVVFDAGDARIREQVKWMRVPDEEHDTVGNITDDTKKLLKEKIGWEQESAITKAWQALKKWMKNWRQNSFDRMQPIAAKLGGEEGEVYMRHRAVPGVMSTVASFLEHGLLHWDGEDVPVVNTQKAGFIKWLTQGLGKDADRFFYWLVAKRAELLEAEGRERWLDEESRQKIFDWVGEPTQKDKTWEDYNEEFQVFNNNILDFAQEAGLINENQRMQWQQEFYIPFYRILENQETREEYLRAPGRGKQHLSSTIRRLYGAEAKLGDPLHNIIRNWSNLIGESMANRARSSAYDYSMQNPTMTEDGKPMIEDASAKDIVVYKAKKTKPGEPKIVYVYQKTGEPVLSFMRDGKKKYFKVNDVELFNALSLVNRPYFDNIIMKLMGTTKHWLTYSATFGPAFKVKNMIRDSLHSYTIVPGFKPWDVFKGIAGTWTQDQDYVEFMASGNSFTGSYIRAEDPNAMEKYLQKVMPRENVVDRFINDIRKTEGKTALGRILDTPAKLLDLWTRIGDASENAVRLAIFKKYKAEEGRLMAGFKARDVMDFQMSGASPAVQFLIQTVPFLNARAQGLYKMGREAKKNPVSYITKGALIGIASIALWAVFKDDERYKELEDWEKWSYYHFWIGDQHFRIPKPFETGVVWSSMYEAFGNVLNGTEDGKHIIDFFSHAVQETLAFNPIPQLFMPMMEQYFNKVFFTGRPIENQRLQGLNYGERYDPWTSETMRLAGKLGIPPKRAETFIRGYFSTIGMLLLTVSDLFVRNAFDFPERPTTKVDRYPLIGAFYRSAQAQNTKFANRFYDMAEETNRVYNTIKFYRELGDHQYADGLLAKYEKNIAFRKRFNAISRRFSEINNSIRNTWLDEIMDADAKSDELERLYKMKNDILRQLFKDYEGDIKNGEQQ